MPAPPKTIQIFLPGGDPHGIRVAEITTRIVQVIEVPRSLLSEFLAMPESQHVALYFLVGQTEDREGQRAYVGQTGDLRTRLIAHNKDKEFWQRVLILISRTQSLTGTHALFLEWYCLQAIDRAGRFESENGNSGSKPHTPAPLEADCLEVFATGRTLLATLGFPIFDAVAKPAATAATEDVFYCKGSDADGKGLYTPEGFVVLKGSAGRKEVVPSSAGTSRERLRTNLIQAHVIREAGDRIVFEKDHLFSSPSAAAIALQGRNANGWTEWRNAAGESLNAVKRQAPI